MALDALGAQSPLDIAAAIGVEMEKLYATVAPQFNQEAEFYGRLANFEKLNVSGRLVRIPILVQPGSGFAQFSPDGVADSMGTGGAEQYDVGVCSPVFFVQACQITKGAEWEANSKEKSVVDVVKDSFRINSKQFRTNLEALLASSDGSGTLSTVSVTPISNQNNLQVGNAEAFQAGVVYNVYASLGGANRGQIQVLTTDPGNNIIYLVEDSNSPTDTQYWPTGTVAGDLLLVSGAPGTATASYAPDRYTSATVAASLNGVPAINLSSSSGDWFGIPRTTWPGVLNPAYVNGNGALTPQIVMLLQSLMQRYNGADAAEVSDFVLQANLDQVTAWESIGLFTTSGVGTAFVDQKGGETRKDYLAKNRIKTLAGHELMTNIKALQGRIDAINFKHWFKTEVKPPSLFDIQGTTVFPLYGSDGGVAPTSAFYFVAGLQMANNKPRAGGYIDHLSIPAGY